MSLTFPPSIDHFDHQNLSNPCPLNGYKVSYYDIYPKFDYGYIYDCNYFFNWEGMPVVNWRTMKNYVSTIYIVPMLILGVIGVSATLISGLFVIRTDILVTTAKYYLVGYSTMACYVNLQNFYRVHCMLSFDPNNAVYNHTYNSFPCLNTNGYPYCGFMLNEVFTSFWLSAVYSMYLIIFILPTNRFLSYFEEAKHYTRFCRFPLLQIVFIMLIPAVPILALIGHDSLYYPDPLKRIPPRDNIYGMFWSPLTQMPYGGYYQRWNFLHDLDPLLWLFIAPHVLTFFAEISFMHNVKKLATVSPKQSYMESRLAKQMFITHLVTVIGWLIQSIYGIFIIDLSLTNASMTWFIVQNLNPICLAIVNPIIIAYFYRPNQQLVTNNKRI
ncbi:unnamed protein product, partial [Mesorhabditis belari]|uniref:G protein-coupled receptor n=1 Tax=Mesorhabditis belari TaxID=2138241 RepID=A0AAF3EGR0_9BILA